MITQRYSSTSSLTVGYQVHQVWRCEQRAVFMLLILLLLAAHNAVHWWDVSAQVHLNSCHLSHAVGMLRYICITKIPSTLQLSKITASTKVVRKLCQRSPTFQQSTPTTATTRITVAVTMTPITTPTMETSTLLDGAGSVVLILPVPLIAACCVLHQKNSINALYHSLHDYRLAIVNTDMIFVIGHCHFLLWHHHLLLNFFAL